MDLKQLHETFDDDNMSADDMIAIVRELCQSDLEKFLVEKLEQANKQLYRLIERNATLSEKYTMLSSRVDDYGNQW